MGTAMNMVAMERTCRKCGAEKPLTSFILNRNCLEGFTHQCRTCTNEYMRKRYRANQTPSKEASARWKVRNPEKLRESRRKTRLKHIESRKVSEKALRTRNRMEALTHYGGNPPRCACCDENHLQFLALDHVNGGGSAHIRSIPGGGGTSFIMWLRRNNFPPGFQVLCHNCNCAKGFYGSCPHQDHSK